MNYPLKRGMAFHLINFVSSSYKAMNLLDYSKNLLEISAVSTEWSCLPTTSLDSVFYGQLQEISAVPSEWYLPTTSLDWFFKDLMTQFDMDLLEISVVPTKEPEDLGLAVVLVRNCQDLVIWCSPRKVRTVGETAGVLSKGKSFTYILKVIYTD